MTRHGSFKKVVRRHARETDQRYTESLTDLEGLEERLFHEPDTDRLIDHFRKHYDTDVVAATKTSQHNNHVYRVDHRDSEPWIARVFPPARSAKAVEGDAAILRFLERHDFPAERLAVADAVSAFSGASVLVTQFVNGEPLPDGTAKISMMGDLLGRLHALPLDDSVDRMGGAGGDDPGGRVARGKICWRRSRSSTRSTRRLRHRIASALKNSVNRCARLTMVMGCPKPCSMATSSTTPTMRF